MNLETKTNNNNNKYDFYIPSDSMNKNFSFLSLRKNKNNKINDDTYNIYYLQKTKKLLYNFKRRIFPKVI